jgi:DNA-binding GntR family transcriptional regulator
MSGGIVDDLTLAPSAQRKAYEFIREQILSGDYEGGDHLNPLTIAERLGISRMPVREAIRQLDTEGLVTIRPNRGAIVTILTAAEVNEIFEMRAVLEALAARLALPQLRGEVLEELEIFCQRMDRVRNDPKIWIERHNKFHNYLCRQSGRPRLTMEIDRLRTAAQPYLLMYISVYHLTEMPSFEHQTILDAIRSGNTTLLEVCVRDHVMSAGYGVIEHLKRRDESIAAKASVTRKPKASVIALHAEKR